MTEAPQGGLSTVRNAARLLKVFRSREADLGPHGAGLAVVHRDPADGVAAGRHHQGVVGQGVAREDVIGLGHQVAPGRRLRAGRIGDRDPEPGRVQVGVQVQAAVGSDPAVGLGVKVLLDLSLIHI